MARAAPATEIVRTGTPYRGDVQIRVHGVSGTPPEELLDRAATERVSGDRIAGFYRPAVTEMQHDVPVGTRPGTPEASEGPWLEGYSWGGWTSGAKTRALWLMLAPFALLNVAPRMLPPDPGPAPPNQPTQADQTRHGSAFALRARLLTAALIRLLAATLTITFVLGVAAPMLTTVARRCGAPRGLPTDCHGLPLFVTDGLSRFSPAGQLGIMTLVPALLVGLLWLVSRSSARRYATGSIVAPALPGRPDDEPIPLRRPDLWNGGVATGRLRTLHVQIALTTIALLLAMLFPGSGLRTVGVIVAGLTLLAASVLAAFRLPAGRGEPAHHRSPWSVQAVWAGVAASIGLGLALVITAPGVGADASGLDPDRLVRDADAAVRGLVTAQAALLLLIAVTLTAARMAGAGRGRSMFMAGYAGFFMAFLGWLLGTMMAASVVIMVPAWLGLQGFSFTPGRITEVLQQHPSWFGDTSRSSGFGMLIGIGILLVLLVQLGVRALLARRRGGSTADRQTVRTDYPGHDFDDPEIADRVRTIGFMLWTARRIDRVPRAMVMFCLTVAAVFVIQGIALMAAAESRPAWLRFTLGEGGGGAQLIAWGVYLTGALLIGLLALGVLAYRTAAVRRGVGVLWDLACFWPRDAHPFAPPCYNERIMPEVRARIAYYVGGLSNLAPSQDPPLQDPPPLQGPPPLGRVVLAGHSQGSVISLAAVLIQPPEVRERLSLMTFGCVLDRLYSRFFPRYFSPEVYELAASVLTIPGQPARWMNLWRPTDYLGGSVPYAYAGPGGPGPRQVRCVDPVFDRAPGDVVYPTAGRHSGFWLDPVFQQQIRGLLADMAPILQSPARVPSPGGDGEPAD